MFLSFPFHIAGKCRCQLHRIRFVEVKLLCLLSMATRKIQRRWRDHWSCSCWAIPCKLILGTGEMFHNSYYWTWNNDFTLNIQIAYIPYIWRLLQWWTEPEPALLPKLESSAEYLFRCMITATDDTNSSAQLVAPFSTWYHKGQL